MKEFKKSVAARKAGTGAIYFTVISVIAANLSGWICDQYPILVAAAGRLELPGLAGLIGVDKINCDTLPTVMTIAVGAVAATVVNWWKRVLYPSVAGFIKNNVRLEK
jgi:hypothetical protein